MVVRWAIDNYNPIEEAEDMSDRVLMEIVSRKLKEAIKATDRVSKKIRKTVNELEAR